MATKQELIEGLAMLTREAKRLAGRCTDEEWRLPSDEGGWNNREAYAHVAGVAGIVVPFATGMLNAPAGTDMGAALNIDQINAGIVAARADKSIPELAQEFESAYGAVAEWLRGQPDETFEKRATIGGYRDMTVGDLLMQMVVMHGLAHLYHAASRFP
jgi:hypothetical protein